MRLVIGLFVVVCGFSAHGLELLKGEQHWSAGSGLVGRLQEDVNPQMSDTQLLPQFFVQFHKGALAVSLEGDWQEQESRSGAFSITSRTFGIGLWGRYELVRDNGLVPFLGAGVGSYFDTVTSRYQDEEDQRQGKRRFLGVGGGLGYRAWKYLLVEGEIKAALIQDRKDATYSGILRLGVIL